MSDTERKWTPSQLYAVNCTDRDLLLSAGAGSGKTATLTERVCRLVTDEDNGIDVSRMLIVTFTKAAAEELRSRVRARLEAELEASPSSARLARQLVSLESADISTISSADRPSKVKTTYVSRVGTTFTVKVQKVTKKKPTGYQIQYTTNKKSWKGAKSKKFKKLKMTVKGLMSGRTYYFRIRAYRRVKGQTVYGKWSKRKKI